MKEDGSFAARFGSGLFAVKKIKAGHRVRPLLTH
jgi:hypothetical protein